MFILHTFIPCHLEIALRGLSALRVRKLLRAMRLSCLTNKLHTDTSTMKQSKIVHMEEKYFTNPKEIHLSTISTENRIAKVTFKYPRIICFKRQDKIYLLIKIKFILFSKQELCKSCKNAGILFTYN